MKIRKKPMVLLTPGLSFIDTYHLAEFLKNLLQVLGNDLRRSAFYVMSFYHMRQFTILK